ncbi:hypothetical protein BAUCODRAFT_573479 [Baudoinia panamericana UAMH 10762]|uniref:Nucleoporin NUP188 n=1 Tax=Baudoinia panamericana (strain UAMH 10762) TaxID=717646 RepID=M2LWX9_BAUPA|nr:uncharacterized protein BAUCODRAFT_573479 [Baudoinia panamericana UAMH 10762]EMC99187.1 hypothetical protein BAUCODRAFT_573479 [Baudoinia panamericana UAMH 10762]
MAEPAYFPSLDKCLAGDDLLMPWTTAYNVLCDLPVAVRSYTLEYFLNTPEALKAIENPFEPFGTRSPESKARFETKTAPIHVTQGNGAKDLEQLKKDALWLSEQVQIEEEAALRIAIVESQQRPIQQLLTFGGQSQVDVAESNEFGVSMFARSTAALAASANGTPTSSPDFGDDEVRQLSLLQAYLDERHAILKLAAELIGRHVCDEQNVDEINGLWIDRLAKRVAAGDSSTVTPNKAHNSTIRNAIAAVRQCLEHIDDRRKWPTVFTKVPESETIYATATYWRLTDLLRHILARVRWLSIRHELTDAETVQSWFKLMDDANFIGYLGAPVPSLNAEIPQCLAGMVSLAVVQLPQAVQHVDQMVTDQPRDGVQYPALTKESGSLCSADCARTVTKAMYNAARGNNTIAAPVMYAWALIATQIRNLIAMENNKREARELRLVDSSSDAERATTATRRGSRAPADSEIRLLWDWFLNPDLEEVGPDPARFFMVAAVDRLNAYGAVSWTSSVITAAYGSEPTLPTALMTRGHLYDLLRQGLDAVGYESISFDATLAVLTPGMPHQSLDHFTALSTKFMADDERFRPAVLDEALARYPYELTPLLQLCTILAAGEHDYADGSPTIVQVLENVKTVTLMVPEHFRSYTLENEDENANGMALTADLPIFAPRQESFAGERRLIMDRAMAEAEEEGPRNVMVVPAGASGIVAKEDRPMVLALKHPHSALEYVGLLLSTLLPGSDIVPAHLTEEMDRQTAADIVALITALLTASLKQDESGEDARFILGRVGFALHDETDIAAVIGELFELELLSHLDQAAQPGSLELCVACAEFFTKLTWISPERVWSLLARSSLLGAIGGTSALAAVVGGTEAHINCFRFLAAVSKLYNECLQDAVAGLVKRKSRPARANSSRFDSPMMGSDTTPERTIGSVLNKFTRVALDACQNFNTWRFANAQQKGEVSSSLLDGFGMLLRWTYGLDKPATSLDVLAKQRDRISALLVPAAEVVLNAYAPSNDAAGSTLQEPLTATFADALTVEDESIPVPERGAMIEHIQSLCSFLCRVLRTARFVDAPRAYRLATELLKTVPTVAMLIATSRIWKLDIATYLTELVLSLDCTTENPPSLLSGLSTEAAKAFLIIVAQLDRPVADLDTECEVWRFLTAVLESRQQWFSMYLLTGTLPKDKLKSTTRVTEDTRARPLLAYALDELSRITQLVPARAKAMLRFVAAAQSVWVWSTVSVRQHPDFLKNALAWLDELQPPQRGGAKEHDSLVSASEHQAAAYLCEILAVNLHASLETGNQDVLKLLVPKLAFLSKHACAVDAYNRSLHRNLAENMGRRFGGVILADFKKTEASPTEHGRDFAYDFDFADRVLQHQSMAWGSVNETKAQGYAAEVIRANVNLSLLDAQINLLRSWKTLAMTLGQCVKADQGVQEPLIHTVEASLRANEIANLEEPGMIEAAQIRAELAFVVLSKLVDVKCGKAGMKNVLSGVWALVVKSPADYSIATAPEDLVQYRTLLQILFLAIRPHIYSPLEPILPSLSANIASMAVEIVARLVGPAFRALCGNLHGGGDLQTSMSLAQPTDFALITATLQAILSIRGVQIPHIPISDATTNSGMVRGALSLYSWSDQLAEVMDNDPVYGEIAVSALVTLSSIPQVAEQMALEGVLLQLSNANLSNYFRKPGGKGQWDEPARMYGIWTDGFLPLCLNLLDAVGPALAGEVAAFLNSFPEQLARAEKAFQMDARRIHSGEVSLGMVKELHALVLVGLTIQSDVARAAAEGLDAADVQPLRYDVENAKAEMQKLARPQRSWAGSLVATNEREALWATGGAKGEYGSELERRVVTEVREVLRLFGE